ncbi:MAG: TIGR00295 family protein [Candidatus Bathyarchaeia archaeon]
MKLPSPEEAVRLMREAGCSPNVVEHCINVTRTAMNLADSILKRGFELDIDLVEVGALMHDLGRSRTHGVEHGAIGGKLARGLGLPEALARVIERHVGAGIPCDEAELLGLPRGSYVPETLEEKIVAYADKLVEGNKLVDIEVTVEKFANELGGDHPALDRLRALHDEMVSLMAPSPGISQF